MKVAEPHCNPRPRRRKDLAYKKICTLASALSLPTEVRDNSERICDAVMDVRSARCKPLPTLAASSLYAACRKSHMPVTIKELATVSGLNAREIGRCYRSIMSWTGTTPPGLNGTRYALKIAGKVHASSDVTNLSMGIIRKATLSGLGSRNPMTLSAAALYTACLIKGVKLTQADAADAAGVDEASVRNCAKAIRLLVPVPAA